MPDCKDSERLAWSGLSLHQPVHERFEWVASTLPTKLAVQTLHRSITYEGLNRLANRIANKILRTGAAHVRDTPIGILMPQGIHLIAAVLGVMKAGGFYVPLDPSIPAARTEHMVADAGAFLFVVDSTVGPESRAMLAATATLIDIDALEEGLEDGNPAIETDIGNLAYLLYTSGSTGAPKGVMQSHRHMMHNAWVHSKSFGIEPHDRQSLLYPCNVYGSVRDTFNALLNGASLHVLSVKNEELALLPDWLRNERISIYCSVATVFRQLGRWLDDESHFPDLRIIKLGGEVVYAQDVALYRKHFSDQCRLSCGLASTETGAVAQYFIDKTTVVSQNTAQMGIPVDDTEILLLDDEGLPVQDRQVGEIAIRSRYLSSGYWRQDALTAQRFQSSLGEDGLCIFRTGDLGEKLAGGAFVHRGRKDFQVKIRGNRIEIPDVEQAILRTGAVREVAVIAKQDGTGQLGLIAYVEWVDAGADNASELRRLLREKIPAPMIPSHIVALEKIPLLPNGKKDRNALPEFRFPVVGGADNMGLPADAVEKICSSVLGIRPVPRTTNFFELGADSLKLVSIYRALVKELKVDLMLVDIFQHPTVEALSEHLRPKMLPDIAVRPSSNLSTPSPLDAHATAGRSHVAIIGMAGRFPGAADVSAFWRNIVDGVEMRTPIDMEELKRRGTATDDIDDPNYVPVTSFLADIEKFDNGFFRMTRREAELLDPQMRILLECGVEAFEDAGELPSRNPDSGVFVSVGKSNYYLNNVRTRGDILAQVGDRRALLFNDRTYAATLLSYKLDLRGPSLHIDTACSSSLVAVHHAVRSLQAGDCKLALAGGARVIVPHGHGYVCGEGGIESSSGQCRPFDRDASGTVFGNGAGVVLLKRLEDAVREGNHIYGVIRGSAVGNDGGAKVGFTAPAASGQAFTIQRALHDAKVAPSDIQYVETHGTATVVGDPIEIAALNQAFSGSPDGSRCPIGSIKGNVGHMSTASGVVGLMKVALAIKHKTLPPSIHYEAPNPHIPFHEGPFYVNTSSLPWGRNDGSRIAGVSSFGLGGTNAHIVVEQPPEAAAPGARADADGAELLVVSGQTSGALAAHVARIAAFLRSEPQVPLKHTASTLARGRTHHACRTSFVGGTASALLKQLDGFPMSMRSHSPADARPKVAFLFPGQGTQYVGMMRDLYCGIPDFAGYVDTCCVILEPLLQEDLRHIVFPPPGNEAAAEELLRQTRLSQPVLFVFEYALARLWIQWGVEPVACLGHSLGEYVAACLSGVFSLESALGLVVERGRWMQSAPPGAMLAVSCTEAELSGLLAETGCSLAAINSTRQMVVSGTFDQVERCKEALDKKQLRHTLLPTSHAFHSHTMDVILEGFRDCFEGLQMHAPKLPIVSNLTGDWLSAQDAVSADYWVRHLRATVRFHDGIGRLADLKNVALIEVGPGQTLKTFVEASTVQTNCEVIPSCRHRKSAVPDDIALKQALGLAWEQGVDIDWDRYHGDSDCLKISLPTYPFQRERFWIEPGVNAPASGSAPPLGDTVAVVASDAGKPRDLDFFLQGIAAVWGRLLGVERVRPEDNFFLLGGDSMVLVQVQRLLLREFGAQLELAQMYQHATAADLARCLLLSAADARAPTSPANEASASVSERVAMPAQLAAQDVAALWEEVERI